MECLVACENRHMENVHNICGMFSKCVSFYLEHQFLIFFVDSIILKSYGKLCIMKWHVLYYFSRGMQLGDVKNFSNREN